MKAKFGAIVVAGSGKLGGHVFSKNRSGAYIRTKVTPVNPQTSAQMDARNRLSGLSSGWRGLTDAQRSGWNAGVKDFAKTDIFGDLKNPSGVNLYQRLNNNLLCIGQSAINDCPAVSSVFAFSALSAAADVSASSVTLTFSDSIPVGTSVKVFATPALSAGKSFVKSEYRLIAIIDNTDTSPADVGTAYEAKFGDITAVGSKIFVKLVATDETTGMEGTPISAEATVVA